MQPTVVIADDESLFRLSVVDAFAHSLPGVRVLAAADGAAALELFQRERVDLLITDLRMPRMSGLALLGELASRGLMLPVVVLTAFGTPEAAARARELGSLVYLDKPVDLDLLAQTVMDLLGLDVSRVTGVTLEALLQLMEMEGKTCTMRVAGGQGGGYVVFRAGTLWDAGSDSARGIAALQHLLSIPRPTVSFFAHVPDGPRTLQQPLGHALLELARLRDEGAQAPGAEPSPQRALDVDAILKRLMQVEGALAAAVVDYEAGEPLGSAGGGPNFDVVAAGLAHVAVIRSELQALGQVGLDETVDDVLISLRTQYHLVRPLTSAPGVFVFLATDRARSNLAMARLVMAGLEKGGELSRPARVG